MAVSCAVRGKNLKGLKPSNLENLCPKYKRLNVFWTWPKVRGGGLKRLGSLILSMTFEFYQFTVVIHVASNRAKCD